MRHAITVRLPDDLADWLAESAASSGRAQGQIIRQQLEKARSTEEKPFLRLAGRVSGAANLSQRKGFAKK